MGCSLAMIISEEQEAVECGVMATQQEILKSNTTCLDTYVGYLTRISLYAKYHSVSKTWMLKELHYRYLTITISITYNQNGYASN